MANHRPQAFVHGSKLTRKAASEESNADLQSALIAYAAWKERSLAVEPRDYQSVGQLVQALNEYKSRVEPIFDSRPNSAQELLQPSIIEEFMEYLFCRLPDLLGRDLVRRPERGYLSLVFHPKSIQSLLTSPEYTFRRKDHDFVIGGALTIGISTSQTNEVREEIVVPAVALECKRYLERNMLDECSGTAARIKRATPYCLYIIAAEYLKMDDSRPELSEIDEIFILRKQRNSDRLAPGFVPKPVDVDVVWDLYQTVMKHLQRIWWDPDSVLTRGKLFDYPQ